MSFNFEAVIALKKGDVIWECSQYGSLQVELLEDPVVSDVDGKHSRAGEKKVEFVAKVINQPGAGREISYLLNNLHMHYSPKLYNENVYMSHEEIDADLEIAKVIAYPGKPIGMQSDMNAHSAECNRRTGGTFCDCGAS